MHQPSMFDEDVTAGPALGDLSTTTRTELSDGAWVDHRPGWLTGSEQVLDTLLRDVPWRAEERQMYDRQVAVPRGLLRLAVQRQIPVVVYYTGLDLATGCRYLGIEQVNDERLPQALADGVFGVLDRLIRTEPTAWHFWGQMPRFMSVQVPQRAA